jgi:hypothetical protein
MSSLPSWSQAGVFDRKSEADAVCRAMAEFHRMEEGLWYGTRLPMPVYDADAFSGDMIHLNVFGQHFLILNTWEAVNDLLNKRSAYSGRPQFTMISEL